jgi:hypothetical protein
MSRKQVKLFIIKTPTRYRDRVFFVNTYILYINTPRPNTNRHVHAQKCLQCAGIETATSCVVGVYSHHYAKLAVR